MISKINEIVLNTIHKYSEKFNTITIADNILTFNNEQINLKDFNLETIFQSYQLKLDLEQMEDKDLFNIIRVNANIHNSKEGV